MFERIHDVMNKSTGVCSILFELQKNNKKNLNGCIIQANEQY